MIDEDNDFRQSPSDLWRSMSPVRTIDWLKDNASRLNLTPVEFTEQTVILRENEQNDCLYIILEGEVQLTKLDEDGDAVLIDKLGAGAFLGLISFWTREPALSTSVAIGAVTCIELKRDAFMKLTDTEQEFNNAVMTLVNEGLTKRYRNVVKLNMNVATLSKSLGREKEKLSKSLDELQKTKDQLVNREKLAIMGQLLAGIAHEINNPCSSLLKSCSSLSENLQKIHSMENCFWREGFESDQVGTERLRARMNELETNYPNLNRSEIRRLSRISAPVRSLILEGVTSGKKSPTALPQQAADKMIQVELALDARTIHSSATRISAIIQSLKSYGRPNQEGMEVVDVRKNIQDTLIVLNNRLKHREIELDIQEVPSVFANSGEINQILTNLLVNALEATDEQEKIKIRCYFESEFVRVDVEDTGLGIEEENIDKIFEPNFTTKHAAAGFGLGLGLSLSKNIAIKHLGDLSVRSDPGQGACFTLSLPVKS